jgi:hypothetical protein
MTCVQPWRTQSVWRGCAEHSFPRMDSQPYERKADRHLSDRVSGGGGRWSNGEPPIEIAGGVFNLVKMLENWEGDETGINEGRATSGSSYAAVHPSSNGNPENSAEMKGKSTGQWGAERNGQAGRACPVGCKVRQGVCERKTGRQGGRPQSLTSPVLSQAGRSDDEGEPEVQKGGVCARVCFSYWLVDHHYGGGVNTSHARLQRGTMRRWRESGDSRIQR